MVVNEMVGSVTYNFIDAPPTGMAPGIPHLFTAQAVVSTTILKFKMFFVWKF